MRARFDDVTQEGYAGGDMGLFRRTRTSLKGISAATEVRLVGRVASKDEIASPMAGGRAALFQLVVGVRYMKQRSSSTTSWSEEQIEVFDRLATEAFFEYLLIELEGGLLAVPRGVTLEFPAIESLEVLPVSSALPGRLADAADMPGAAKGVLSYQELSLSHGDPVQFEGWVVPFRRGDAYRSAASVDTMLAAAGVSHVADLERGLAVLRDLSMEAAGFRRSAVMNLVGWLLRSR